MKRDESIQYRGYDITKHLEDDYAVEVGHDTLQDAKDWIDRCIAKNELDNEEQQLKRR